MPTLEDDGFVLWESNAILFYMAAKHPETGLWPADLRGQADVVRWLAWGSAHWDAESCGMVSFEKASSRSRSRSLVHWIVRHHKLHHAARDICLGSSAFVGVMSSAIASTCI